MTTFSKQMKVGRHADGACWVTVEFDGTRLAFQGVIGPRRDGNCRGSGGQIAVDLADVVATAPFTAADVARLAEVWKLWHLNDMRAGCAHQRRSGRRYEIGEACPVCDYRYGSAWLHEDVPADVIDWLAALPESPGYPWSEDERR